MRSRREAKARCSCWILRRSPRNACLSENERAASRGRFAFVLRRSALRNRSVYGRISAAVFVLLAGTAIARVISSNLPLAFASPAPHMPCLAYALGTEIFMDSLCRHAKRCDQLFAPLRARRCFPRPHLRVRIVLMRQDQNGQQQEELVLIPKEFIPALAAQRNTGEKTLCPAIPTGEFFSLFR